MLQVQLVLQEVHKDQLDHKAHKDLPALAVQYLVHKGRKVHKDRPDLLVRKAQLGHKEFRDLKDRQDLLVQPDLKVYKAFKVYRAFKVHKDLLVQLGQPVRKELLGLTEV